MKLQYKYQDFQQRAVKSVVELFLGQKHSRQVSDLAPYAELSLFDNNFIVANALDLSRAQLLENMHRIQERNHLPLTYDAPLQFTIEMETGTGKTYVYTKTIYELNRCYGFSKFIIVVPSVAVREGVCKSLESTAEHFAAQYDGVPCHHFRFSSDHLSAAREFASSDDIEIMVITIDAFKRSDNRINRNSEQFQGQTALGYICQTSPIVIIDEPQSVDNTGRSQEAIASLNPLFVLRYSATHRQKINLLYRLTPVDACRLGLVKRICVCSPEQQGAFNGAHMRLISVSNEPSFKARLEIDTRDRQGKVRRKTVTVKPDSDIYALSGKRALYSGLKVISIDCTPEHSGLALSNGEFLTLGKSTTDDIDMQLAQIKRTIATHLDKELTLNAQGIKVLSLFFIDEVAKYRTAGRKPGQYAIMFENAYRELIELPRYASLKERYGTNLAPMHDGYFSQDRKGCFKNTRGDTQSDSDTYNTIMRDKEWLLSLDCPLRFIFSHSALKEGWDNPNVFQVCTLIEQKSPLTCRQKIGRGLRLCVNQEGERIESPEVNVLHVMATEGFADFAATLQSELEEESGLKFGVIDLSQLSFPEIGLSLSEAQHLWDFWREQKYLTAKGQVSEVLRQALYLGELELPDELEPHRCALEGLLGQLSRQPLLHQPTASGALTQSAPSRYETWHTMWKQIAPSLRYRLDSNEGEFIEACSALIADLPQLHSGRLVFKQTELTIDNSGVSGSESQELDVENSSAELASSVEIATPCQHWPDILAELSNLCDVKRSTVYAILKKSQRLAEWSINPQLFLERCAEVLRAVRHRLGERGFRLVRRHPLDPYTLELSDSAELIKQWQSESKLHSYRLPPRFALNTPLGTFYPRYAYHRISNGLDELAICY